MPNLRAPYSAPEGHFCQPGVLVRCCLTFLHMHLVVFFSRADLGTLQLSQRSLGLSRSPGPCTRCTRSGSAAPCPAQSAGCESASLAPCTPGTSPQTLLPTNACGRQEQGCTSREGSAGCHHRRVISHETGHCGLNSIHSHKSLWESLDDSSQADNIQILTYDHKYVRFWLCQGKFML